jgi:hypothetical protein
VKNFTLWLLIWAALSLIAFGLLMCASVAMAYPQNIRHGYASCDWCHVSGVAGGGVTNAYGRDSSEAVLSTWASDGEANPAFGAVELPKWLAAGADARYINVNARDDAGRRQHLKFWMQNDAELAVMPTDRLTVDASAGFYGPQRTQEFRRSYVRVKASDNLSLRAGHFLGDYGVMFEDHRLPTRAGLGLGEGGETYNLEAAWQQQQGEIVWTGVYGPDANLSGRDDGSYRVGMNGLSGYMARAAVYAGTRAQLGVSAMRLSSRTDYRHAYGAHAILAFNETTYLLAEVDRRYAAGQTTDLAAGKLGWEVLRGLHLVAICDVDGKKLRGGGQIRWFPRPHFEVLTEIARTYAERHYVDSGILMLHYFL